MSIALLVTAVVGLIPCIISMLEARVISMLEARDLLIDGVLGVGETGVLTGVLKSGVELRE